MMKILKIFQNQGYKKMRSNIPSLSDSCIVIIIGQINLPPKNKFNINVKFRH